MSRQFAHSCLPANAPGLAKAKLIDNGHPRGSGGLCRKSHVRDNHYCHLRLLTMSRPSVSCLEAVCRVKIYGADSLDSSPGSDRRLVARRKSNSLSASEEPDAGRGQRCAGSCLSRARRSSGLSLCHHTSAANSIPTGTGTVVLWAVCPLHLAATSRTCQEGTGGICSSWRLWWEAWATGCILSPR